MELLDKIILSAKRLGFRKPQQSGIRAGGNSTERRVDPRFRADQAIRITRLDHPDTGIPARIVDISARGFGVESKTGIPPRTAVQVHCNDSLLLAEVVYSRQIGDGRYAIGLKIEHAIFALSELSDLFREEPECCPECRKSRVAAHGDQIRPKNA